MNDTQNIKRILLPFIKGLPVILGVMILSLAFTARLLYYATPVYESTTKIKLADINEGTPGQSMYKDFDVFASANKIASEVEMLKSKSLVGKTIDLLDFQVSYNRIGELKTTEMYHQSPFLVSYLLKNEKFVDQAIQLTIFEDDRLFLIFPDGTLRESLFDVEISTENIDLIITKNPALVLKENVDLADSYSFTIHSREFLINQAKSALDVTSIDKEVPVIRISYQSPIAEKTSAFVNKLAETYIEDYIEYKTATARKTVDFIDSQITTISGRLKRSENTLEDYKNSNNIINTHQETETDLRKISQMKIQLANLEMNEAAIDSLASYMVRNKHTFLTTAPNFEEFTDLLSTEMIKKIKELQGEKAELLLKYTSENERVKVVDRKLMEYATYLQESIKNSKENITIKRKMIDMAIREAEQVFVGLPTKEKEITIMERNFNLNEKIYLFLSEKRTEAAIAENAAIAFHRVISIGDTPSEPIFPKKGFIMIFAGFLGLISGIILVYLYHHISAKITSKNELEKYSMLPVAGTIPRRKHGVVNTDDFATLSTSLFLHNTIGKNQVVTVTSTVNREGKTFIAWNLAKTLSVTGYRCLIIDLNLRLPQLCQEAGVTNDQGITEAILEEISWQKTVKPVNTNLDLITTGIATALPASLINNIKLNEILKEMKLEYDLVILDSPATAMVIDGIQLMKLSDSTLYVVRANYTKRQYLLQADQIKEEYKLDNISFVINGIHKATNYSGTYTGSRFSYNATIRNLKEFFSHYLHFYFK